MLSNQKNRDQCKNLLAPDPALYSLTTQANERPEMCMRISSSDQIIWNTWEETLCKPVPGILWLEASRRMFGTRYI